MISMGSRDCGQFFGVQHVPFDCKVATLPNFSILWHTHCMEAAHNARIPEGIFPNCLERGLVKPAPLRSGSSGSTCTLGFKSSLSQPGKIIVNSEAKTTTSMWQWNGKILGGRSYRIRHVLCPTAGKNNAGWSEERSWRRTRDENKSSSLRCYLQDPLEEKRLKQWKIWSRARGLSHVAPTPGVLVWYPLETADPALPSIAISIPGLVSSHPVQTW